MFNLFKKSDKVGKQTQSAEAHNPIRRVEYMRAVAQGVPDVAYGNVSNDPNPEATFWRASSLRNAEEVKRLSSLLAIHEAREHKRREGLKKATKASADKRRGKDNG